MARPLQAAFRRNQGHIACFMATPARQPAQVGDVCSWCRFQRRPPDIDGNNSGRSRLKESAGDLVG